MVFPLDRCLRIFSNSLQDCINNMIRTKQFFPILAVNVTDQFYILTEILAPEETDDTEQVVKPTTKPTYTSGRGNNVLIYEGHRYIKNNSHSGKIYWKCTKWHSGCKGRAITNVLTPETCMLKNTHNHEKI